MAIVWGLGSPRPIHECASSPPKQNRGSSTSSRERRGGRGEKICVKRHMPCAMHLKGGAVRIPLCKKPTKSRQAASNFDVCFVFRLSRPRPAVVARTQGEGLEEEEEEEKQTRTCEKQARSSVSWIPGLVGGTEGIMTNRWMDGTLSGSAWSWSPSLAHMRRRLAAHGDRVCCSLEWRIARQSADSRTPCPSVEPHPPSCKGFKVQPQKRSSGQKEASVSKCRVWVPLSSSSSAVSRVQQCGQNWFRGADRRHPQSISSLLSTHSSSLDGKSNRHKTRAG